MKRAQEREVEMRLARIVQQKLYPVRAPELEGFDLAGAAFPADHTCGDYYDFVPFADGRVGIAVGDVSGHGFGPALLMAETRAYLRSLSRTSVRPGPDPAAAQPPPLPGHGGRAVRHLDADPPRPRAKEPRVLERGPHPRVRARPLGSRAARPRLDREPRSGSSTTSEFASSPEIRLEAGDLLLLLTDGAAEAQNPDGAFFETERVLRVVAKERHRSAAQIVESLRAAVVEFARDSPQADDITVVVCKVGP